MLFSDHASLGAAGGAVCEAFVGGPDAGARAPTAEVGLVGAAEEGLVGVADEGLVGAAEEGLVVAAEEGRLLPGRVEPAVEGLDATAFSGAPFSEASDGRRLPALLPGLLPVGVPEGRRTSTVPRAPRAD